MQFQKKHFVTVVLGCYFVFFGHLLQSGNIKKFIHPRLSFLTVFTIILLAAMLFHNLWDLATKKPHSEEEHDGCCDHHHHQDHISKSSYVLFLPMVLSMLVVPQTLTCQTSISANLQQADSQEKASEFRQNSPSGIPANLPEEYTQLQIGDIIFDTKKIPKEKLVNSPVYLIGRALRPAQLAADEVVLYRIVITCCVADGLPIGVLVKLPAGTQVSENEWLGVEGQIEMRSFQEQFKTVEPLANMTPPDKKIPYLTATKVYKIDNPGDEYLYP